MLTLNSSGATSSSLSLNVSWSGLTFTMISSDSSSSSTNFFDSTCYFSCFSPSSSILSPSETYSQICIFFCSFLLRAYSLSYWTLACLYSALDIVLVIVTSSPCPKSSLGVFARPRLSASLSASISLSLKTLLSFIRWTHLRYETQAR